METTQPSGTPAPQARREPGPPSRQADSRSAGSRPANSSLANSGPAASRGGPAAGQRPGLPAPARDDLSPPPSWGEAGQPPGRDDARPRVRVGSPADVLAIVPHLLGFHPALSFVVVGAAGPRRQVKLGFRYDLPDPPDAAMAADIADHAVAVLTKQRLGTVIGVGYGPGRLVTPVADAVAAAVRRSRLRLWELLRVEDGRFWSYLCGNPDCCPAAGTPFDYPTHPVAAAMTVAGMAAYPDREALAQTLAPLTGAAAQAMDQAIERACATAQALVDQARRDGSSTPLRPVIDAGRRAVREAIGLYRGGGRITDEDQFATLAVGLVHLAVRDDAWARMVPEHRDAHLKLWADIVRRASGAWLPAPASLLAFTAWQAGDGTLANVALERALTVDPGYSMARLLRDILAAGVPPSQARLPMTPEEVEESYARAEPPEAELPGRRGRPGRPTAPGPRRRPARTKRPCPPQRGDSTG